MIVKKLDKSMRQTAPWADNSSFGNQEILPLSKGSTKSVSSKKIATLPKSGVVYF
jgi:hypothetical protein